MSDKSQVRIMYAHCVMCGKRIKLVFDGPRLIDGAVCGRIPYTYICEKCGEDIDEDNA